MIEVQAVVMFSLLDAGCGSSQGGWPFNHSDLRLGIYADAGGLSSKQNRWLFRVFPKVR